MKGPDNPASKLYREIRRFLSFLPLTGIEKANKDIRSNQLTPGFPGSGNEGWPIEKFFDENLLLVKKFAGQTNIFSIGISHFRPSLPLTCDIIIDPTPHFFDKLGWDSYSIDRLNPRFFNKSPQYPKERRFLSCISIDSDILEIIGRKIGVLYKNVVPARGIPPIINQRWFSFSILSWNHF